MVTSTVTPSFNTVDLNSEVTWTDLYSSLRSFARHLVYSFHVSCWRGQEEDIIEDITQETARRLIERARKAERGEADPIYSLKHMMTAIAQNYCRDLRRVDRRFSHVSPQDTTPGTFINVDEQTHTLDAVAENVFEELIIMTVAHEIASFPNKQRKALLIDLANRMSFDTRPTPLQTAFLQEGIQLKHYQQPLPSDPRERSKHASILSYAYQRIAHLPCVREYISAA
jgi:DNA-directed RNA polymerase specialized sigma24 family protein